MRSITIDTIRATMAYGYSLTAHCLAPGCHHSARLDLEVLAARLGRDHSTLHKDLAPKLVCSRCGAGKVRLNLHPHGLPTG